MRFENVECSPRLIYMHDSLPGHSQNSGQCLPNETDLFKERLEIANHQMRQDLEVITRSDPSAIIIVAGDHGPYLTKNCTGTSSHYDTSEIDRLDVQDRFGTFLAIRWPTDNFEEYDNITVLQDIFPVMFAYLYDDSQFLTATVAPETLSPWRIIGVSVSDGRISGGVHDGQLLFLSPP